ncbi:MAG: HigA family addiction module antidote protein [Cellulomonadaceae bacterium]|jgi:addiction module HigA family antidote|nr:HigA family addiction module antidote protein [Cellulomonadaceae bacterium]
MENIDVIGTMFNPPHPGEVLRATYLDGLGISVRKLAAALEVAPSTLARVVNGSGSVSPEMALRLEAVLNRSAEMWLRLQENYDLWHARQNAETFALRPLPELALAAA